MALGPDARSGALRRFLPVVSPFVNFSYNALDIAMETTAMRLTPEVSLVGGGNFGFGISSPLDCHVYLLDGGNEMALIDAGVGGIAGDTDRILQNIIDDGHDPEKLSSLLLTHYHTDHAGGAAELSKRLEVPVHASPHNARALEIADADQIGLNAGKVTGFYPQDYVFQAVPVIGDLGEGATFEVGHLKVSVFETPGHCDGHVSFLVEGRERRYLLQGDVVFFGGTILLQNIPDCSIQKYGQSVQKLAMLDFDAFLPGHLGISLSNGKRHIQAAADAFNQLMVPKNCV
jgi:hydroxyacylglutathione hydrolase